MYFVKYGDMFLHDPRSDDSVLFDLSLECVANSCGYCDFTIQPNHPLYGKLKERDSFNPIEVYDDDILLFAGFIYELGEEFYLDGHVKCKGELDYLNESIVRPYSTYHREYSEVVNNDLVSYFTWLIAQHNSQIGPSKNFVIGINEVGKLYEGNCLYIENDNYPTTIDELSRIFIGDEGFGGYLRVRHENGTRYIDFLYEPSSINSQVLEFGTNLLDYSKIDNSEDMVSFVVPTGAQMKNSDYMYDDGYRGFDTSGKYYNSRIKYYYFSGYEYLPRTNLIGFATNVTYYVCNNPEADPDERIYSVTQDETPQRYETYYIRRIGYTEDTNLPYSDERDFDRNKDYYLYHEEYDQSEYLLTIKGLPNIAYSDSDFIKNDDMLYSRSGVSKYGWMGYHYANTELTTREDLLNYAIADFKKRISPYRTIEIKAVDMHLVNPDIKSIKIGEFVRVKSDPHKLDAYFLCKNIELDLNDPSQSIYTLTDEYDIRTGRKNDLINILDASVANEIEPVKPIE